MSALCILLQLLKADEDAPMAGAEQEAAGGDAGAAAGGEAGGAAAGEGPAPMETSES